MKTLSGYALKRTRTITKVFFVPDLGALTTANELSILVT
jgi:hypothetical protein